jgi:hypothetical protein
MARVFKYKKCKTKDFFLYNLQGGNGKQNMG